MDNRKFISIQRSAGRTQIELKFLIIVVIIMGSGSRKIPEQFSVAKEAEAGRRNEDEGRLYFIIKSALMSLISALLFFVIIYFLGTVNFKQAVGISIVLFAASLALSRIFEKSIEEAVSKSLNILERNRKIKRFILKYF